jgi:hypothetical protein
MHWYASHPLTRHSVDWLLCKDALLFGWLCGVQWFEIDVPMQGEKLQ